MADHRGIAATCAAIIYLLRANYDPDDFSQELEFDVYTSERFAQPMEAGVSLFLYRVYVNGSHRAPSGRLMPDGSRRRNKLPLDLYFLLTAWGREASLQQAITGWMLRVMEDTPILPSGLLNTPMPGTFNSSESVELSLVEMPNEDLFHLWEILGAANYHISIPYLARNVNIDSTQELVQGRPVQERNLDYRQIVGENGA